MTEWEFLAELCQRSGCYLLLDINNVYVSAYNHNFEAKTFIDHIPCDRVQQFHLAGHTNKGKHIIDTHDAPIIDEVWQLYAYALERFGSISTLIERDDHYPPFAELMTELEQARTLLEPHLKTVSPQKQVLHANSA